jgi:uncharacterized protein
LIRYLDTSAVVSALVREPRSSGRVRAWLRGQDEDTLAISPWVATELSSALSIKVRDGELTIDQRADVMGEWRRMRETSLQILPIGERTFERAADFVARHELGLGAADALHLAVVSISGCTLVTLDERMAAAARKLGIPVTEV